MFENLLEFTEHTLEVMTRAQDEAFARSCDYVHTWHVLIGLLAVKEGCGYALLKESGVDILDIERFAHVQEMTLVPTVEMGRPTWGGDVKNVITLARSEAGSLQHPRIGTEHVLLALLQIFQQQAGDLLHQHLRLTPDDIRRRIRKAPCSEFA